MFKNIWKKLKSLFAKKSINKDEWERLAGDWHGYEEPWKKSVKESEKGDKP